MYKAITGTVPALITPMDERGDILTALAEPLIDYYVGEEADGLYMLGWTGEGMSLAVERRRLWAEAVLRASKDRLPVFVHVGYNKNPDDSVGLARHAAEHGAYAVASVGLPGASLEANVEYFRRISEAAPHVPFYIYWVSANPFTSGGEKVGVTQMLEAMKAVPTFKGIKFTDNDFFTLERFKKHAPGLNILTGADELAVCSLLMGADGNIGSLQAVTCYHYKQIQKLVEQGKYREARELQYRANNFSEAYGPKHIGSLPAIKMILERIHGIPAGYCAAGSPYIPRITDEAVIAELLSIYRENILVKTGITP